MVDYRNVIFEVKDGLAFVTVSRPDALNALNVQVFDELLDAFTKIQAAEEIQAVILTGSGRAFVAGADIAYMRDKTASELRDWAHKAQKIMEYIENIEKPVIAAVNGFALGGGNELAMAADIRFASEKAKFGQPEVNLGIFPFFGGTQRLSRLVGEGNAKFLIFSAEMIDAQEAYRIGLVQKVFSANDLLAETEKFARSIMGKSPIGVKMAKTAITTGLNLDIKSGIALEAEAAVSTFCSEDRTEGMSAFLEKRPPVFKNK